MITSIRLKNFKNFADETLKLGPFTVIVGANASGKSNIRDAFRFLHGIGRGYTLAEIVGGKIGEGGQTVWEPIRGAPLEVARFRPAMPFAWADFSVGVKVRTDEEEISHSVEVGFNQNSAETFRVSSEEFIVDSRVIYTAMVDPSRPVLKVTVPEKDRPAYELRVTKTVIQELFHDGIWVPHEGDYAIPRTGSTFEFGLALGSMRFIELLPERLREPAVPGTRTLGSYGQNLATALEAICADPGAHDLLTSWIQELTPMDVKAFEFPRDPGGRVHLMIVDNNERRVSARSASDGTLRFLALLALLLDHEAKGIYFFEDIDSGIHPNRLWLLLDLIERQTAKGNIQVITTTHSPALLGWMNDNTFENASIVFRDENSANGIIRPVSDLPNIRELRETQGLGRLITSGWMEDALALTTEDNGAAEVQE